jgi:alpha-galactosidase
MPVGTSALLPHKVYVDKDGKTAGATASIYSGAYHATRDYAKETPLKTLPVPLGTVGKLLPSIDDAHTVVVRGFIEVPMTGAHEVHAGFGDSTHAIVKLDGKEVYRKEIGGKEMLTKLNLENNKRYPISITYLKGGSTAFWMELVDLKGNGDLETLVKKQGRFPYLLDKDGEWSVRNDVILCESYLDANKFKGGRSTALTATANGKFIGPELGFGYVMGTFHDEPVLIIKSTIGNRSLAWDCLPPGSERYEVDDMVYAGYKDTPDKWKKGTTPKKINWYAGKQYDEYTQAIRGVLDNFDTLYPQYKDQGYEIAGFAWWQGHKDQNPVHASRYEQNLVNLIKAWRKEFNAPNAKWVIATIAFGGWELGEPGKTVADAQLAVSGDSGKYPEFNGNVKTIEARDFWRNLYDSPASQGFHYNHNAETYMLTGDALGRAMVELHGGQAAKRPTPKPATGTTKNVSAEMTLAEAVQQIQSDAVISRHKGPSIPTPEQIDSMREALRPMIVGSVIPAYAAQTTGVPAYRRHGMSMAPILTGETPTHEEARGSGLKSQLDRIISYYQAAGIDDYAWKRFGPDMANANWHYYSFDPPEKQELSQAGRNRQITLPAGMENWFSPDFNAAKAGWKSGAAPFAHSDGKLARSQGGCRSAACGSGTAPNTLWEKEVLLMRQTFEIPKLKEGHRYRLLLSCNGQPFAGEGNSIYVNGKLFAESKGRGGKPGGYVFNDFLPEFQSGKVTIAVKGFLCYTGRRNKPVPPHGYLSVWLEEIKLPNGLVAAN